MTPLVSVALMLASTPAADKHLEERGRASCAGSPLLGELDGAAGRRLLQLYGYDLSETWACNRIPAGVAPRAELLHFRRLSVVTGEATAFSAMKAEGTNVIWIVPTAAGMLRVSGAESDPHNVAAFNALLRSMHKAPSRMAEWEGLGRLYLAMLGRRGVSALEARGDTSDACGTGRGCLLSFADSAPQSGSSYWKWTLTFESSKTGQTRLTDATADLVPGSE